MFSFFFFKQKTAYEMRISDWSSDVCSSDLPETGIDAAAQRAVTVGRPIMLVEDVLCPREEADIFRHSQLGAQVDKRVIVQHEAVRRIVEALARPAQRRSDIATAGKGVADRCIRREIGRASGRERVCQYV